MYLIRHNRTHDIRFVVFILLLGLGISFLSGCATVDLDPQQEVELASDAKLPLPPGDSSTTSVPTPPPTATPVSLYGPVTVAIESHVPEEYAATLLPQLARIESVNAANGIYPVRVLDEAANADTLLRFAPLGSSEFPVAERYYAVVTPFETVADDIVLEDLQSRWQGLEGGSETALASGEVLVAGFNPGVLTPVLGPSQAREVSRGRLVTELEATPGSIGIVPFDQLDPRLKVLTIDSANVLDNRLNPEEYPLALALEVSGNAASLLYSDLLGLVEPSTNRDAERLTTLIMTGVTAISRGTAAAIERTSLTYPADVISDTLSAADITHVSNEVPFLDDCVVNNTYNNIVLCSHNDYSATLRAIGTDIVGLSGNHVNDFGRDGARRSLRFYRANDIPFYGSGFDVDDACEPLMWEHNGNTFAFVAALAFGPETAWATDDEPGACYYYDEKDRILSLIEGLVQEVDVVAVELQFEESYEPFPLPRQIDEFRDLRAAGAQIVTGVQSHVPQAIEPYGEQDLGGSGVIVYGLGNLFFDQMWSWATRTGLIARHTIYDGRLINTEILTTVLEDFAQPRWATDEEREEILRRIFDAAPARPTAEVG